MKRLSASLGSALFALAALGFLCGFAAPYSWLGELAVNVRWQIGAAALLALPLLGFGGSRWRTAGATAIVLVCAWPVARLWWGGTGSPVEGPEVRVAFVNVLADNRDGEALDAWVRSENPDVVAVLEVSRFWEEHLASSPTFAAYPHRVVEPRIGAFGIALFSREPLVDAAVHEVGQPGLPYIDATVGVEGCALRVLAVHAFPPVTPAMRQARDSIMDAVAGRLDDRPGVVVGDFNATVYSYDLRGFVSGHGLRDTRRGRGRQPTWMPALGPMGLDLDHAFLTGGVRTRSRRVGASVGSDHLPVVVDLVVPNDVCVPLPVPSSPEGSGEGSPVDAAASEGSGVPVP